MFVSSLVVARQAWIEKHEERRRADGQLRIVMSIWGIFSHHARAASWGQTTPLLRRRGRLHVPNKFARRGAVVRTHPDPASRRRSPPVSQFGVPSVVLATKADCRGACGGNTDFGGTGDRIAPLGHRRDKSRSSRHIAIFSAPPTHASANTHFGGRERRGFRSGCTCSVDELGSVFSAAGIASLPVRPREHRCNNPGLHHWLARGRWSDWNT